MASLKSQSLRGQSPNQYFPIKDGKYEVSPGLMPLNGPPDRGRPDSLVFHFDREFPKYRAAKLASRAESLGEYYLTRDLDEPTRQAVVRFLFGRLAEEYPELFEGGRNETLSTEADAANSGSEHSLVCGLTGDRLVFDVDWNLGATTSYGDRHGQPIPTYTDALDALACQIPEDLAVMRLEDGRNWLAAAHVCLPSGWAPREKIGKDFNEVHDPVAGFESISKSSDKILRGVVEQGPFYRFGWGLAAGDALNLHPRRPESEGEDTNESPFARIESSAGLYLRMERQVLWGLPECQALIFFIRVYLRQCSGLSDEERAALRTALEGMNEPTRRYKGVHRDMKRILRALQ